MAWVKSQGFNREQGFGQIGVGKEPGLDERTGIWIESKGMGQKGLG